MCARSIFAASSARSSSRPAGPTKGSPFLSSSSPGCSPTSITPACASPAPKTVWVPVFHSGQTWQSLASLRSCVNDLGMQPLESRNPGRVPMKRWFIARLSIAAGLLAALPALAQQDFSKVEIQSQQLGGTVYMLTGSGGNIGLSVGDDAVFMVDDQFAPLTPKIQEAIAKLSPKPVKFMLNTHWHFDHTGGNENFGKAGAIIVAHENVRKRMSEGGFIEFLGMKIKADPREALPVVTFASDLTLHV